MSSLVPDGWKASQLDDLLSKIEGGGTPSRINPLFWDGNIPWATVKDLKGVMLTNTQETISKVGLEGSSCKLIPENTIIIACRMAVGKAVVFNKAVAINQDLKALYPKSNTEWRFLIQWYLSNAQYIESLGTGSTVKGIRLEHLKFLPINLPPLPEQQKIAKILTSVDEVIEKTQAQIDKLKDLKTGMMQELLTKGIEHTEFKDSPVGRIPVGWEVVELKSIAAVKGGKRMPKGRPFSETKTSHPYIRVTNFEKGTINCSDLKYVLPEDQEKIKRYIIKKSDLYISIAGSIGLIGSVPNKLDGAQLTENAAKISLNKPAITSKEFIKYLLSSSIVQNQFHQETGAGGGVPKLALFRIESTLLPLPNFIEQDKIANVLSAIDKNIENIERKLTSTKSVKKALMQDLLTGKVRVKIDKETAIN